MGTIDYRTRATHDRRLSLPLGAVRTRRYNGSKVVWIKVCMTGPKKRRWTLFARWLWERRNGPVPPGLSVIHRNGNPLDNRLENLVLGTSADRAAIWHHNHPQASAESYVRVGEAATRVLRERHRVRLLTSWFSSLWYPVDYCRRSILLKPCRKRWQIYGSAAKGLPSGSVTALALGWAGWPARAAVPLTVLADAGRPLVTAALQERCHLLRQQFGLPRRGPWQNQQFSADLIGLRAAGMIETVRAGQVRRHHATPLALTSRGEVSPWRPVRGCDLTSEPDYLTFARLEPKDQP